MEENWSSSRAHRLRLLKFTPASRDIYEPWQGSNISDLESHIIHVFETKKGTPIGYGNSVLQMVSLLFAIGYGDILNAYQGAHLKWKIM